MAVLQEDNKRTTLHGVIFMIISAGLYSTDVMLTALCSEKLNICVPLLLLYKYLLQIIIIIISSFINCSIHSYPTCNIDIDISYKHLINSIKSINDNRYIYSRRESQYTESSASISVTSLHA